jgi:transposase
MDAIEQLKQDVREGRIDPDRLIGLLVSLQRQLEEANRRIVELEKKLGGSATVKTSEPFSMRAEEQRQQARGKKTQKRKRPLRRGRISTADKLLLAERTEQVFPVGIAQNDCRLSHTRPVWRLEDGRAVLVAYEVYRGPKNRFGEIPGTLGRSEFGLEFILAIAYQVYIVGLSFDKVCLLMNFFQSLRLRKSQIDALLNQLSRHWASEFDRLCTLLANSAVVHTDETGWSLRSVWAFLSEKVRVLFFGVHKDAETLRQILDPATFTGLVISDDAAIYANFTKSQKCWAHLLRKAIKLTLLEPNNAEYRTLTDRLLEIYRAACRVQADGRLSDAGRLRKVAALDDEVFDLCAPMWIADLPPLEGTVDDYRLLCNELMRLMLAQQLFTFVTATAVVTPSGASVPVSGTNNEAERTLRSAAQARKTGRTNKTFAGARRQTIITSVMESLRQQLPTFTLPTVIEEVLRWQRAGRSCFANLTTKLKLLSPIHSVLDILLPVPAG